MFENCIKIGDIFQKADNFVRHCWEPLLLKPKRSFTLDWPDVSLFSHLFDSSDS